MAGAAPQAIAYRADRPCPIDIALHGHGLSTEADGLSLNHDGGSATRLVGPILRPAPPPAPRKQGINIVAASFLQLSGSRMILG